MDVVGFAAGCAGGVFPSGEAADDRGPLGVAVGASGAVSGVSCFDDTLEVFCGGADQLGPCSRVEVPVAHGLSLLQVLLRIARLVLCELLWGSHRMSGWERSGLRASSPSSWTPALTLRLVVSGVPTWWRSDDGVS